MSTAPTKLITQDAAKSLAVRYDAWHAAGDANDDQGKRVWGRLLLQSIEETGCFQNSAEHIRALISAAERRQDEQRAA